MFGRLGFQARLQLAHASFQRFDACVRAAQDVADQQLADLLHLGVGGIALGRLGPLRSHRRHAHTQPVGIQIGFRPIPVRPAAAVNLRYTNCPRKHRVIVAWSQLQIS